MGADQLQKIYDREVHFQIVCIWDTGFEASFGDGLTGYGDRVETRIFNTAREALDWLDSVSKPTESPQT